MVEAAPQNKGKQQPKKKVDDTTKINALGQLPVGRSKLMLWHRPTQRTCRLLKDLRGVTMIITAQAKRECPQDVRKMCE